MEGYHFPALRELLRHWQKPAYNLDDPLYQQHRGKSLKAEKYQLYCIHIPKAMASDAIPYPWLFALGEPFTGTTTLVCHIDVEGLRIRHIGTAKRGENK